MFSIITNEIGQAVNQAPRIDASNFVDTTSGFGSISLSSNFAFDSLQSQRISNNGGFGFLPSSTNNWTAPKTANYYIAFRLLKSSELVINEDLLVNLFFFKNGIGTNYEINLANSLPFDTWFTFGMIMNLNQNDVINFGMACLTNSIFYLDAYQISQSNTPVPYQPTTIGTGWNTALDTVNVISLVANTPYTNVIDGLREQNGNLSLIDINGNITPVLQNDTLGVDFAFTIETPAGSNNYLSVFLNVNGVNYRGTTHPMLRGLGIDDFVSISWSLPVGEQFKINGASIVIVSNVNCNIKDRYLFVERKHIAE